MHNDLKKQKQKKTLPIIPFTNLLITCRRWHGRYNAPKLPVFPLKGIVIDLWDSWLQKIDPHPQIKQNSILHELIFYTPQIQLFFSMETAFLRNLLSETWKNDPNFKVWTKITSPPPWFPNNFTPPKCLDSPLLPYIKYLIPDTLSVTQHSYVPLYTPVI